MEARKMNSKFIPGSSLFNVPSLTHPCSEKFFLLFPLHRMIYKDFVENHTLTNDAGGSSCIGGSWDFVNREQLISCAFTRLPNNVLTIGCELSWCYDIGQDNFDFESPTTFSFQSKPSGLLTFFNDPIYNQFIIEIGEKTLYASKLLLAQKNSVFRALFANSGFLDSQQKNSIRIDDVDPEAFEGVLKYWYTEAIPNIEPSQAKEWLKICDRYDISSLKVVAVDSVKKLYAGLIFFMSRLCLRKDS